MPDLAYTEEQLREAMSELSSLFWELPCGYATTLDIALDVLSHYIDTHYKEDSDA